VPVVACVAFADCFAAPPPNVSEDASALARVIAAVAPTSMAIDGEKGVITVSRTAK
jgi:hypothetical protein